MTWPQPDQADLDLLQATESWLADIPAPADALPGTLQRWVPWTDTGYARGFTIYSRAITLADGQATVEVHGWQHDSGQVERTVVCKDMPVEMTGQEAAAVLAALAEAVTHT